MSIIAINVAHIKAAVAYLNNRPPLNAIKGPADLVSFAMRWIPLCWHELLDERPSFDGKCNVVIRNQEAKQTCKYGRIVVPNKCNISKTT